jgi:ankyrin repeat protein
MRWIYIPILLIVLTFFDPLAPDINTRLFIAILRSGPRSVEKLLEGGADVNARGRNGLTPLMCAAIHGHLRAMEVLLRRGARKDLKDDHGKTALDYAREHRWKAIALLLE